MGTDTSDDLHLDIEPIRIRKKRKSAKQLQAGFAESDTSYWYFRNLQGQRKGPYVVERMRELFVEKRLTPTSLVREGWWPKKEYQPMAPRALFTGEPFIGEPKLPPRVVRHLAAIAEKERLSSRQSMVEEVASGNIRSLDIVLLRQSRHTGE